ncbi:peptidoglycan recognition protein [Nocardioides sp. DS6]|uniref:Peptidoglycan recognition protein n=1 Tax=Nocardioides eburneus TaxID=3231482 RepID=A0ABV3T116_9ACTN
MRRSRNRTRTRLRLGVPALFLALLPLSPLAPGSTPAGLAPAAAKTPLLTLTPTGGGVKELDVPLGDRLSVPTPAGHRTGALTTSGYSMVGVSWKGRKAPARVLVRWRTAGKWRGWHQLPLQTDLPGAGEGTGRQGTQPVWTGRHRDLEVAVKGVRAGLQLTLMDTGPRESVGTPSVPDGVAGRRTARMKPWRLWTRAPYPKLYSRAQWGADPSWRNGSVRYNKKLKQVHIHHTDTANGYSRGDVPGILRGMYRYHTHTLGWFDIAYNFLIDRFGRVWVGRSGGPRKLVRGAHTLGFNQSSVGVAMIGTFNTVRPTKKAITSLVRLAAWKLDAYHRKATGRIKVWSQGSDLYPPGKGVVLPVVDGHRDTNQTACPGTALYKMLPYIRKRIWAREQQFNPKH